MKLLEYIFIIIGALTIIKWLYKLFKFSGRMFCYMFEAGLRNKYSRDYLPYLSDVIALCKEKGFEEGEEINIGEDKAGIKMIRGDKTIEVYLDAPLTQTKVTQPEIEVAFNFKELFFKIRSPRKISDGNKKRLSQILALMDEN